MNRWHPWRRLDDIRWWPTRVWCRYFFTFACENRYLMVDEPAAAAHSSLQGIEVCGHVAGFGRGDAGLRHSRLRIDLVWVLYPADEVFG